MDVRALADQLRLHELNTGAAGGVATGELADMNCPVAADTGAGTLVRARSMDHVPSYRCVVLSTPSVPARLSRGRLLGPDAVHAGDKRIDSHVRLDTFRMTPGSKAGCPLLRSDDKGCWSCYP